MATLKNLLSRMIEKINKKAEKWEDLPDRPFGDIPVWSEYFNTDIIEASEIYDEPYSARVVVENVALVTGIKYKININYNEYIYDSYEVDGMVYVGDTSRRLEETPFRLVYDGEKYLEIIWSITEEEYLNGAPLLNMHIYVEAITTKQIDKKFIPDGVGGGVRTVNGVAPDAEGNVVIEMPQVPEIEIPELTWDNIEDKPAINGGTGEHSIAEGYGTQAIGNDSHAEGDRTIASGKASHAEGAQANASGNYSHAEGFAVEARYPYQHVQGVYNIVEPYKVVAIEGEEGFLSRNSTDYKTFSVEPTFDANIGTFIFEDSTNVTITGTLAEGTLLKHSQSDYYYYKLVSYNKFDRASGKYIYNVIKYESNISAWRKSEYAHIVGNGTSNTDRSNAHTLDWDGNAWFSGDVYVGGTSQDDGEVLAKMSEVIPTPTTATVGQTITVKAVDENGKPTEWEAVDAQANWNVEDETSPAYIKNKPFGVKTEMVEIVPEQSVTGVIPEVSEGESEFYQSITPPTEIASLKLKENASYKVVFNGKEYICKTELWEQEFTGDGVADVKGYKLSTGSIPNGDVGFTISRGWSVLGGQTEDDVNTVIEWSIDNGETITLEIYEEKEIVTPLDIKYLPIEELKLALGIGDSSGDTPSSTPE